MPVTLSQIRREFGQTRPIGQGNPGPGMAMVLPRAVTRDGTIFIPGQAAMRPGISELPDAAPVLRYDRATQTAETVAMVKSEGRTMNQGGSAGNESVSIGIIRLSGADGWTVDADGRVGIARVGDYHFEWIDPNGSVTAGAPVDVDLVRIGQGRIASRPSTPPVSPWIWKAGCAGEAPLFDVFGTDAEHVASVQLPAGRRLQASKNSGFAPSRVRSASRAQNATVSLVSL